MAVQAPPGGGSGSATSNSGGTPPAAAAPEPKKEPTPKETSSSGGSAAKDDAAAGTKETSKPPAPAPKADKPPTDTPPVDAPPADAPKPDKPEASEPKPDKPAADTPPVDAPPADTPKADKPQADKPRTGTPKADAPSVEPVSTGPGSRGGGDSGDPDDGVTSPAERSAKNSASSGAPAGGTDASQGSAPAPTNDADHAEQPEWRRRLGTAWTATKDVASSFVKANTDDGGGDAERTRDYQRFTDAVEETARTFAKDEKVQELADTFTTAQPGLLDRDGKVDAEDRAGAQGLTRIGEAGVGAVQGTWDVMKWADRSSGAAGEQAQEEQSATNARKVAEAREHPGQTGAALADGVTRQIRDDWKRGDYGAVAGDVVVIGSAVVTPTSLAGKAGRLGREAADAATPTPGPARAGQAADTSAPTPQALESAGTGPHTRQADTTTPEPAPADTENRLVHTDGLGAGTADVLERGLDDGSRPNLTIAPDDAMALEHGGTAIDLPDDLPDPSAQAQPPRGVHDATDARASTQLKRRLASEQQHGEAGTVIAGSNSRRPLRDSPRLAAQYGGHADEWTKRASTRHEAAGVPHDRALAETHWYQHEPTGRRVEEKTKFPHLDGAPSPFAPPTRRPQAAGDGNDHHPGGALDPADTAASSGSDPSVVRPRGGDPVPGALTTKAMSRAEGVALALRRQDLGELHRAVQAAVPVPGRSQIERNMERLGMPEQDRGSAAHAIADMGFGPRNLSAAISQYARNGATRGMSVGEYFDAQSAFHRRLAEQLPRGHSEASGTRLDALDETSQFGVVKNGRNSTVTEHGADGRPGARATINSRNEVLNFIPATDRIESPKLDTLVRDLESARASRRSIRSEYAARLTEAERHLDDHVNERYEASGLPSMSVVNPEAEMAVRTLRLAQQAALRFNELVGEPPTGRPISVHADASVPTASWFQKTETMAWGANRGLVEQQVADHETGHAAAHSRLGLSSPTHDSKALQEALAFWSEAALSSRGFASVNQARLAGDRRSTYAEYVRSRGRIAGDIGTSTVQPQHQAGTLVSDAMWNLERQHGVDAQRRLYAELMAKPPEGPLHTFPLFANRLREAAEQALSPQEARFVDEEFTRRGLGRARGDVDEQNWNTYIQAAHSAGDAGMDVPTRAPDGRVHMDRGWQFVDADGGVVKLSRNDDRMDVYPTNGAALRRSADGTVTHVTIDTLALRKQLLADRSGAEPPQAG